MTQELEDWVSAAKARAIEKTSIFIDKEKEKLELDYPEKLLNVVPRFLATPDDVEAFKLHVDALIAALPETTDIFKANLVTYKTLVKESRAVYSKKYNLIQKGAVQGFWLSIGLSIGVSLGLVFGKIGLGLPLGLAFGLLFGASMESKAAKEGRLL